MTCNCHFAGKIFTTAPLGIELSQNGTRNIGRPASLEPAIARYQLNLFGISATGRGCRFTATLRRKMLQPIAPCQRWSPAAPHRIDTACPRKLRKNGRFRRQFSRRRAPAPGRPAAAPAPPGTRRASRVRPRPPLPWRWRRTSRSTACRTMRAISSVPWRFASAAARSSAARSIRLPSGRQTVASPTTICAAPFGAASASEMPSTRASRLIAASWRSSRSRVSAVGADHDQRRDRRRRHVHLRAHRADAGDQIDQPVDLVGGGIVGVRRRRPCGMAEQSVALAPSPAVCAHSSSVMNGMNGMQQLVDLVEHIGRCRPALSALAASSSPLKTGFSSSRYQSQNWFQTKR